MKKNNLLPAKILTKTVNDLYNAGLNIFKIAKALNMSSSEVRKYLPDNSPDYPEYEGVVVNQTLIDQILYDSGVPVAREVIVDTEKARYEQYAQIEAKSLQLMNRLLSYYLDQPEGDFELDQFRANLASTFIKTTQQVRDELLKKYAIDMRAFENEKDKNCIRVEFIPSPHRSHEG